jgi:hypothetical protein
MKNINLLLFLGAASLGLVLAGCSTPQSRIDANPAAFNSLPPQQQALVKAGQVGIGMSMEAVKLSLGDPDRVTSRTDAQGQEQVWHYVQYESGGVYLYTGYYHRWRHGGWGGWWGPGYPWYMDYPNRSVYDRISVEFRNGQVVAINKDAP